MPRLDEDTPGNPAAKDDFGKSVQLDRCGRPCPRFLNPGSTQTNGPSGSTFAHNNPVPVRERYNLRGPQVEPDASHWTVQPCRLPCVISISRLSQVTDDPASVHYFPPYPDDDQARAEIEELVELASLRDDPAALVSREPARERREISQLLEYRPQPLGAVYNLERDPFFGALFNQAPPRADLTGLPTGRDFNPRFKVLQTGRELARYFESETPGLGHRHALNYLLTAESLSPPRQAWIWATLDIAIYSALLAAWHYKWIASESCHDGKPRKRVSFRPRPWEFDNRVSVLFNREVDPESRAGDGPRRTVPSPSPGTPRHPSYPSGHSTYSGAASELLSYFFPDYREELDRLADNAGMARLWAGIHYRSDHINGLRLGRAVARLVIQDIEASCVPRFPDCCPVSNCAAPPTVEELCARAKAQATCCKRKNRPDERCPDPKPAGDERPMDPFLPEACGGGTSNRDAREFAESPQKGGVSGQSNADVREQGSGPQEGGG
jgi:membrane-associated phospholipid phosphatase